MHIYDAIMRAAEHIETHPMLFNFGATLIPEENTCGTPGCALGWIGHFVGLGGRISEIDVPPLLGLTQAWMAASHEFYVRLDDLDHRWRYDAHHCALALRAYAAKYHAPKIPDWNAIASTRSVSDAAVSQELLATGDAQ